MLLFFIEAFFPGTEYLMLYFHDYLQRVFSFSPPLSLSPSFPVRHLACFVSLLPNIALNILCWVFKASNFHHCPGVSLVIGELLPREENQPASL